MTFEQIIVLALPILPLVGAVVVWSLGPNRGTLVRAVSVSVALVTLVLASYLAVQFILLERTAESLAQAGHLGVFVPEFVPGSTPDAPHSTTWDLLPIGAGAIQYFMGVDALNLWMVVLTAVLMLPCILVSFNHVSQRVNEFYAWLLALQTCVLGVFLAFDIFLFYVFFELSLLPLFFLIGIWGGSQRQYAARKFVIYTLAGSLLTLLGVLGAVVACQARAGIMTFSIPVLVDTVQAQLNRPEPETRAFWAGLQVWVFLALSAGFAVKVPLMPLHTWLPLAHVEAPTAGSVDLAGVLLKIGAYGFLRLCVPLCPDVAVALGAPLITWLAAIGIVYGALCAFAQDDVKKLVAYSSVSHMGLLMLGMFSLTTAGIQGSIFQMINHGLSTSALFLLIGMVYERYHTRKLSDYGGMASRMPVFGFLLVFAALSSVGLPGLNGFVGEFLCLSGIYQSEQELFPRMLQTVIGASGMILGAWYLFTMLRGMLFGPVHEPHHDGPTQDLTPREWGLMVPIVVLCVVIGVWPSPVLRATQRDAERIVVMTQEARERLKGKPPTTPPPPRAEATVR
jgi:NADH-quinone oxidoreductase subunit M